MIAMPEKPMIGSRVPVEWKDELERIARQSGRNSSQVVHEAIATYLGKESAHTLANQVKDLSARMVLLEQQIQGFRMLMGK